MFRYFKFMNLVIVIFLFPSFVNIPTDNTTEFKLKKIHIQSMYVHLGTSVESYIHSFPYPKFTSKLELDNYLKKLGQTLKIKFKEIHKITFICQNAVGAVDCTLVIVPTLSYSQAITVREVKIKNKYNTPIPNEKRISKFYDYCINDKLDPQSFLGNLDDFNYFLKNIESVLRVKSYERIKIDEQTGMIEVILDELQ